MHQRTHVLMQNDLPEFSRAREQLLPRRAAVRFVAAL